MNVIIESPKKKLFLLLLFAVSVQSLSAQVNDSVNKAELKNFVDVGPMGDIFIVQYGRALSESAEFVVGASYTNPAVLGVIKYPGTEEIYTLELGYRRYLWKNLHGELQLDPQYFICVDTTENKSYKGFGLTTEIRLGYRFDFNIKEVPFFVNLQWFAGYHIVNPKPESFQEVDGGSFYISPIPMFFLGARF